jgi:hypothetical protein
LPRKFDASEAVINPTPRLTVMSRQTHSGERGEAMSCYLRHLDKILAKVGIKVTPENRKQVDEAVHRVVGVEYKHCPDAWKAVKAMIAKDDLRFAGRVKEELDQMASDRN